MSRRLAATPIPGLSALPVTVSWKWRRRIVATWKPVWGEHDEWTVEMKLVADSPFLAAIVIGTPRLCRYGRIPASTSNEGLALSLGFEPVSWHNSPDLHVSVLQRTQAAGDAQRVLLESERVKLAPPEHTSMQVGSGDVITTGTLQPLASVAELVAISCVLVSREDVAVSHDRWRLPETTPLSVELAWLKTGRRSGEILSGREQD